MTETATARGVTRFERVGIDWKPDPLASRLRFGLVALATDLASETELHRMLPAGRADLFVSRVHHTGLCDVASLRAMGEELAAATARLVPGTRLEAIAYGCTSGTAAIGFERVAQAIRSERPGVAVVTPLSAARAAMDALGVARVAVLTPYVDEVNEMVVDYMEGAGIGVTRFATFGLDTDEQMTSVPPEAIERAVLDLDLTGADGVFVSCTAMRSAVAIEPLERRLGLPVITSNQAMLWQMLQAGRHDQAIEGFGRLLRSPGTPAGG